MGSPDEGVAAGELLCERAARRDGGRLARSVRHLFRHHRRAGLRVARRRRPLEADRFASAAGAVGGGADSAMIRVLLPYHLRMLAKVGAEVQLDVTGPVTQRSILDALESRYPMLCGTIRDHVTGKRRPMLRFYACEQDLS